MLDTKVIEPDMEMPPFQQYYPSLDSMSPQQKKYFEYWRDELTVGAPRTADSSYIFLHIYQILSEGVSSPRNLEGSLSELRRIHHLYAEQVGTYIDGWTTDLLYYHKAYPEAYERKTKDPYARNGAYNLNQFLNLKYLLHTKLVPEDIIPIAKTVSYYPSSILRSHISEALELIEVAVNNFHITNSENILSSVIEQSHLFSSERPLFSGVPAMRVNVQEIDFLASHHLLNFALNIVVKTENILRDKYGRKKTSKTFRPLTNQTRQKLWEVKIHEPFENPSASRDNCTHKYLRLINHWVTYRQYACCNCEQVFMCDCDKRLAEGVRPHQIKGEWLKGICPKCRGLDDTSFITDGKLMYGSTFFAKHWREIGFERAELVLSGQIPYEYHTNYRNDAENAVRERYGIPLIGEGWVSETALYKTLKDLFSDLEVIHHGKTDWLGRQHLDVYIPALNIAFEYQGRQHQEAVEYFGGKEAFEATKQRDKKKAQLCKENVVKLFYIYEGEDFSSESLTRMLKEYIF